MSAVEQSATELTADVATDDAWQLIVKAAVDEIVGATSYEAWWSAGDQADVFDGLPINTPSLREEYDYQREVAHEHADAALWAATPLIREAVARQIEALDDDPLIKALVSINPSAQAVVEWAAATARGETR